uniref:DUF4781 domain-containing protein n=1 Tax=Timema monikensis TaxID=170555 RepID=A0A7R9EFL6_9NEOP|nr:unnamed protein product [Timema monikensis]
MGKRKEKEDVLAWKSYAKEQQQSYMELLKERDTDLVAVEHLDKTVGFAMFGPPDLLPDENNFQTGYDKNQLKNIRKVCRAISRRGYVDEDGAIPLKFLFVCTRSGEKQSTFPVFKLMGYRKFVDWNGRVYKSWKDFHKNNKLAKCRMCYPTNGEYTDDDFGRVNVEYGKSPASNVTKQLLTVMSLTTSVAASSISIAAIFTPVGAPLLIAAGVGGIASGTYSVANSVASLKDRKEHDKTLSLGSSDARGHWFALAAGTAGIALSGTTTIASRVLQSGHSLALRIGLTSLTATTAAARGLTLVNSVAGIARKIWNGEELTALDKYQLASFALFFTGTVLSTNNAVARLQAMQIYVKPEGVARVSGTSHYSKVTINTLRVDQTDAPSASKHKPYEEEEEEEEEDEEEGDNFSVFWGNIAVVALMSTIVTVFVIARTLLAQ